MSKKDKQNEQMDVNNPSSMPTNTSGYPMSGMPFPMSGMPYVIKVQQKKMSTGVFAAIAVSIVIAVAIIGVVLVIIFGNNDDEDEQVNDDFEVDEIQDGKDQVETNDLPLYEDYMQYSVTGNVVIDSENYRLKHGMLNIDNSNMVSVTELADMFGFTWESDITEKTVTLYYKDDAYVFTHDDVFCKKISADGSEKNIGITKKALMFSNERMYASIGGLKYVFMFESVAMENGMLTIKTNGEIVIK